MPTSRSISMMSSTTSAGAETASALWTAAEPRWVLTPAGYAAVGVWNLLVVAMGVLAFASFRRRGHGPSFH